MSAIDDMALSDEALEAWMAIKPAPRPLVRTMSALDGFVTAAVTGPRFPDPQYWMCPLMGLPRDVLAKGSATDHAVFASVARIHNRINETLFDRPQDYAPRFATKPSGGIDPRPWCQGFYAAINLNIKKWKRLLDLDNPNHGLLLPILIYCVDKRGGPSSASPGQGQRPRASSSMRPTKTSPSSSPPCANSTTSPVMTIRSDRRRRGPTASYYLL
ncbi:UPF0149 family protein [Mesorhizobium huakuii]|uniref:UPF0149 family protein n=1 Tax=Mesorhizobium huakuii TaxID=28104 RepID=UPI001FD4C209|nr:UPF0149 family protein [Mesorhizobium huakuii]